MKVNFGDYVPISTIDDYGHASVVIFLNGCDLKCWYCHNKHLINKEHDVDIDKVKEMIKESSKYVSSVTLSGGEPLLQPEAVMELAYYAKELGLDVVLYTSGNHPEQLRKVIKLIDRCYIDIKMENAKLLNHALYMRNVFRSITVLDDYEIETYVTMVVFDTTQETIDEIDDYKCFIGDHRPIIIQGIAPSLIPLTPEQMKGAFFGCAIRTKENGVEMID